MKPSCGPDQDGEYSSRLSLIRADLAWKKEREPSGVRPQKLSQFPGRVSLVLLL
jgi:hypothetical protein